MEKASVEGMPNKKDELLRDLSERIGQCAVEYKDGSKEAEEIFIRVTGDAVRLATYFRNTYLFIKEYAIKGPGVDLPDSFK